ncbi:hypothetical protein D8Y22_08470 [Salinadaptatus halalkaliphilus]|uniref:Antitoxin n=1 Tax=Salinadaptatus halalkaliphilus TaxID=2419781 RepID=A0A4S3TM00_9EURY|nr:antitoxin VapB family protein [Salinadaptatus halalkaliphilus]THE65234.1 hypothetical protein D8Y22_08470 [Salinadaptatus halalkaliphilus]
MGTSDEQIPVSDRVKRELERRKRPDESYNDVLERVLGDAEADFEDGFGILSDEQADRIRDERETAKGDRKDRLQRLDDA